MNPLKLKQAIEYAKQDPDSAFSVELRRRIQSGVFDKELHQAGLSQFATAPKKDNIVQAVAKDVVNTLVVKPAQRATEAVTRVVAPNSDATKGYEAMADSGESQKFNIPVLGEVDAGQQKAFGEGGGKQIAGEVLKIGSFLFPYGRVAKVAGVGLGSKIAGEIASGATGGYMADVGYNLEEGKSVGESLKPGVGTAIGAGIPIAGALLKSGLKATKIAGGVSQETKNETIGRILQGKTEDVALGKKAFDAIDTTGVKTRSELSQKLDEQMKKQMEVVDNELAKDPTAYPLKDFKIEQKNNAGKVVKTDAISRAFNHLDEMFSATGDDLSRSNLNLLKQKALTEGLTRQEVNNIARMYSEEFGAKAFNKLGDPLTSVTAQMYEGVRKMLKQASRGTTEIGKTAQEADRLYFALENTKRLIDRGVEAVNKLEQRVKKRNIVEKLSNNAMKMVNAISGGAIKEGVSAIIPSNVGNKVNNWIDLENSLRKDLSLLKKANSIKEESAFIKFLNEQADKFKFPGDKLIDDVNVRVDNAKTSALINKAKTLTEKNGGVTITLKGDIPTKGYVVAPYKYTETKIPNFKGEVNVKDIDNFINKYASELNEENAHFGAWVDKNELVLDVSKVYDKIDEAIETAKKGNQDAIFNLDNFESIYAKDFKKYTNTSKIKGENKGTAKSRDNKAVGIKGSKSSKVKTTTKKVALKKTKKS